jgi:type I restriction enzyme S subunit
LYYILSDDNFFEYSTATAKGTKMPRGDKSAIMNYTVPLPPLPVQRRIAKISGSLDDKIANNTKINYNLEQLAQAIFKSWFVDFEPFGGKMPKDWRKGCLGDYCCVKSGYAFKSSWWQDSGVKVIKIKNIDSSGLNLSDCSFVSTDKIAYANEFLAQKGDLLIAMTGAMIGKFAIVPQYNESLLVNQRVGKFFLGTQPLKRLPFLYCTLKEPSVFKEIVNRGQGSAQPNISPSDIMTVQIVIPSNNVMNKFNQLLQSSFEIITFNFAQSHVFSCLRDTLLPRLMSGNISAPNSTKKG